MIHRSKRRSGRDVGRYWEGEVVLAGLDKGDLREGETRARVGNVLDGSQGVGEAGLGERAVCGRCKKRKDISLMAGEGSCKRCRKG